MPLIKSKSKPAFKKNVSTLMHEIGKGPHVKSQDQALAIAYKVKREGRAKGGGVHLGAINSAVPGRTDLHPMDVPSGAYVIPADHVSSLGEGNTAAGMKVLDHMFGSSGHFAKMPRMGARHPRRKFAEGGVADGEEPVPINAAGGEYVISPEIVEAVGGGDIKRGHEILDKWVVDNRKNHIATLKKLPGPAKS